MSMGNAITYFRFVQSPIVHDDALMCIYSFDPYIVLEIDLKRGRNYKTVEAHPNYQWYNKGK